MQKTERIHALDALRAIMMMLGLVLHTCTSYGQIDKLEDWPFLDPQNTHLIFDVFLGLIHLFRMPIFFLVSGFFGALLFYERSPKRMFINRFKRIVLPFIVFLILLSPLLYLAFETSKLSSTGVTNAYQIAWQSMTWDVFFPITTGHLWFLFYLALLSFFTWGLALFLQKQPLITRTIRQFYVYIHHHNWLKMTVLTLPLFALFAFMQAPDAITSTSIIPDWRTFFFYGIFYWYGWILFKEKQLLASFRQHYWRFIIIGLICFSIKAYLYLAYDIEAMLYLIIGCNVLAIWCFTFGISGWFLTHYHQPSKRMRYISDASYWVYLIHLPIVAYLPSLLFDYDIFVGFKWLFVLSTTTVFCFLTYHFLVRSSFVGEFLNGRRY